MYNWTHFLSQQGARKLHADAAEIMDFGRPLGRPDLLSGFVSPLDDLGLIALTGDDAANFLHNQLTNDVEHLGLADFRLAGYCTAKGRLLATFLMWRNADTIFLQVPRAIQAAVQKRLQMYVMRAKVKLQDVTDQTIMLGLGGIAAENALRQITSELPSQPYSKVTLDTGCLMRLADSLGSARYQWITSAAKAIDAWPTLIAALKPAGAGAWRLSEIHAGVPQISLATQEKFVPQMINFELIGGVNFKKGCYPGQEIVARSQYLGKLKRRTYLSMIDTTDVAAGMEVFTADEPEQPCGMIVNAEPNLLGGSDCLIELKSASVENNSLHLESATGATIKFAPLPYLLSAEDD